MVMMLFFFFFLSLMRGFVFAVCAFAITIESILFGTHANLGVFGHLEIESLLHLAIVLFIDKKESDHYVMGATPPI